MVGKGPYLCLLPNKSAYGLINAYAKQAFKHGESIWNLNYCPQSKLLKAAGLHRFIKKKQSIGNDLVICWQTPFQGPSPSIVETTVKFRCHL